MKKYIKSAKKFESKVCLVDKYGVSLSKMACFGNFHLKQQGLD